MRLGIDIGGTDIKFGIVNEKGEIIERRKIKTIAENGYKYIKSNIIEVISELTLCCLDEIEFIGVGVPGLVDNTMGKVVYSPNLKWEDIPLGIDLKKHFKLPILLENDATCAAVGESLFGATKNCKNSVFITLGTGVGGGIIINGKLYRGEHGIGSEIGHMIVGENYYNCGCGNNGCLETFVSSTSLVKHVNKLITEENRESRLENTIKVLDSAIIFRAARDNDSVAVEAVNRMIHYLTIGIGSLANILDPEKFVIGGGISLEGEYLLERIKSKYDSYIMFPKSKHGDIFISQLKNDAGVIGASFLNEYS